VGVWYQSTYNLPARPRRRNRAQVACSPIVGARTTCRMTRVGGSPAFKFAEWPNDQVPRRAVGVHTVWRGVDLIYAGMSSRGAQSEDFVTRPDQQDKAIGLWTRLKSHASGRRSGDQFNIYLSSSATYLSSSAQPPRRSRRGLPSFPPPKRARQDAAPTAAARVRQQRRRRHDDHSVNR
jgi:hypothetical protein